jgi:hypothetical protein
MDKEKDYSPYCPICDCCGEDGCCSAAFCKQHKDGHYCETYLNELKFSYWMYKDLMNLVCNDPKYKDEIDKIFDKNWEIIFKPSVEDNKEVLFPEKLKKANETLERTKNSLPKIKNGK